MDIDELVRLDSLNKKRFQSMQDYYDFLMFHIQSHIVEIEDLRTNKDPHMVNEMADIAILGHMLALSNGADKKIFSTRLKKFEKKIKENS